MPIVDWTGWIASGALALLLFVQFANTRYFVIPRRRALDRWPSLSVLVPARNEERSIRACISSLALQDYDGEVEVLVLDDHSEDGTAGIVEQLTIAHPHVRLLRGEALPEGWRGKNWACEQLGRAARGEMLLFTDADTIHEQGAAAALVSHAREEDVDLLSLMPRQILGSLPEALTVPLLHFFYLTFFPRFMLEKTEDPRFHAANGQLLLFDRSAWEQIGGHASIASSVVDDLDLAKRIREEGLRLDVVDGRYIVSCRMYRSWTEVFEGFTKNLHAALGRSTLRALFVAAMLIGLFVVPPVVAIATASFPWILATIIGLFLRLRTSVRSGEPLPLALLHPASILIAAILLLRSTWYAESGRPTSWKGRDVS